jgi:hypothetical protein
MAIQGLWDFRAVDAVELLLQEVNKTSREAYWDMWEQECLLGSGFSKLTVSVFDLSYFRTNIMT